MIRFLLYIKELQKKQLEQMSEWTGKTLSQLIREAIDRYLATEYMREAANHSLVRRKHEQQHNSNDLE